jgi:purine-cytosine permease-like protein
MSTIADWCTILFFLWFGLKTFIPALSKGFFLPLGGIIALAAAVTTFIDTSP